MAGPFGVALLVWPAASALPLTIRWAGRALYRFARPRRPQNRSHTCNPNRMQPAVNASSTGSPASNTHRKTAHTSTPHTAEITSATAAQRNVCMPLNYPWRKPR